MFVLLFSACTGGSKEPTRDVVSSIPWPQLDTATYRLVDEGGKLLGSGVLTVEVSGGTATFTQVYASGANRDEAVVVANSRTLKTVTARRTITGSSDEAIEVTYGDKGATIKNGDKQSGLSVPEHSYDNDISLFLWRTIDFREGYTARYTTVITNRRSRQSVELEVVGKEAIKVPAGQFNAWKLEVRTENAKQTAWFADTPPRTLLKYDNDRGTIFELENFLQR